MANKINKRKKLSNLAKKRIARSRFIKKFIQESDIQTTPTAPIVDLDSGTPNLNHSLQLLSSHSADDVSFIDAHLEEDVNEKTMEDGMYIIEPETESDDYKQFTGRRIVDIYYLFQKLQAISSHDSLFECNFNNLTMIGEKRIGLISHYKLKCNLCGKFFKVSSDNPSNEDNIDVNSGAVSGIVASGIGYSQFEELCAAVDIPVFTERYYLKLQNTIFDEWEATAVETMEKAAEREKEAAIKEGRIKNGKPIIDVYVDGAWCARSYGNNYRASSGVAAVVGRKFGEVLYIGIKNKYCLICERAKKKNVAAKEHTCYKNYEGPSSGMYGVIYGNVIADGDSSTYAKIIDSNPYPDHVVCKIECRNHVLRNMCNKLRAVTKDTKYSKKLRKLLTDEKILSMRKVIKTSINYNKDKKSRDEDIENLHMDIKNSINHAFGDHRNCKDYYCTKEKAFSASTVPELESSTMWFRLRVIINTVASKSRSLYENVDTNTVERFNSVVAKFVGGKRINFSLRRSYQSRCNAAVVAFNTKKPLYTLQKKILGHSPSSSLKKMEERREKKRKLSNAVIRKKNRKRKIETQNDYGSRTAAPDMSPEDFEKSKKSFLQNLKELVKDREVIQKKTILQKDSSEWLELRKNLITASNFGKIIKRQKNFGKLVKNLLYAKQLSHISSIAHGVENEQIAIQQLAKQENLFIEPCGLFVHPEYDFIGASPDGIVGNYDVVEVKCPMAAYKMGMKEAIEANKVQIYKYDKKRHQLTINKNSDWYYQAQGQLIVTGRQRCIFGIWGGENKKMEVLYIKKDEDFWKTKMKKKLVDFYFNEVIPELVDSRHARGMSLRRTNTEEEKIKDKSRK